MAIDWDEFQEELKQSIDGGSEKTDKQLASNISSITRMTDEEVMELFPEPTDAKHLAELMQIVHSSEDRNRKINKIMENTENFGGVVLTLLGKFA